MHNIILSYLKDPEQFDSRLSQLTHKFKQLSRKNKALTLIGVTLWLTALTYWSIKIKQRITRSTAKAKEQGKLSARRDSM